MLDVNEYNIEKKERLLIVCILLSLLGFAILQFSLPAQSAIRSYSPYFFIALVIYFVIVHLKIKKLAEQRELKLLHISMKKGDKRSHYRHKVQSYENIKVSFELVKYLWVFKHHSKKLARAIDISAGGMQFKTDTSDITEGAKVERLTINFDTARQVVVDALVVRVVGQMCSVRFINLSKSDRDFIESYVLRHKIEAQRHPDSQSG